jgi:hypothetical protein
MRLCCGIVYCGLVRIINFFFMVLFLYNHIMFVKVMDEIMFQCVHTFTFLCGM